VGVPSSRLTNKLYYSRDRDPVNTIRDQFRLLIFQPR
jgi:hypothetical protein